MIALVALSLGVALASAAVAIAVLVRLPTDYLRPRPYRREHRSAFRRVTRNAVGGVLIAIGALLAIPGVPGPGLLLVLAGLLLLDFRGKRRLVTKLLARPPLLRAVNGLRCRFSQPPLELARSRRPAARLTDVNRRCVARRSIEDGTPALRSKWPSPSMRERGRHSR